MNLKIYCDGGSRGNPGPAACAFIVFSEDHKMLHQEGKFLGAATNNMAEYSAVILSLEYLKSQNSLNLPIVFFLDSQLVVSQLNGLWKVKNPKIRELIFKIHSLAVNLPISYHHIPRAQNSLADRLVNEILDKN